MLLTITKWLKIRCLDLLKDNLTITGIVRDGIIDFAVLASDDVKASPLNDGILEFFVMRSPSQSEG